MNARQSKSFTNFTFAFIAIVAVGFGILVWAGNEREKIQAVDNVAQPY